MAREMALQKEVAVPHGYNSLRKKEKVLSVPKDVQRFQPAFDLV